MKVSHDIVVVGSGLAGLRAAIAAAEKSRDLSIAIVSKTYLIRCHSVCAEGGINTVLRETDEYDTHAWDTVKGSDFLADQDAVDFLSEKSQLKSSDSIAGDVPGVEKIVVK